MKKPMTRKSTRGTRQLGVEIAESLRDELDRFTGDRGETIRQVVELALRRHFDNPPPVGYPPLPPMPPPAPKKRRGK